MLEIYQYKCQIYFSNSHTLLIIIGAIICKGKEHHYPINQTLRGDPYKFSIQEVGRWAQEMRTTHKECYMLISSAVPNHTPEICKLMQFSFIILYSIPRPSAAAAQVLDRLGGAS